MRLNSAIYEGWVRHRRTAPVRHEFRNRLFTMYLDLAELPRLQKKHRFWFALARFRRADYLGDPARPLDAEVRDLVERRTGRRPTGAIRMLTHLRYFGYCFNPVTFYYCFDGDTVEAVVAEITNTPWGERHAYVVPGGARRHRFRKEFHVSPFMGMDYTYDWSLPDPGERLVVHMENRADGAKPFDATLVMKRRAITRRSLASVLARFPFMTLRVVVSIYWHALRLRLKRCPFHTHPSKIEAAR